MTTAIVGRAVVGVAVVGTTSTGTIPPPPTDDAGGVITGPLVVWAVDPGGVRRGQLHPIAAKAVVRDADLGTWTVTVDASDDLAARVTAGWRVIIQDDTLAISGRVRAIDWATSGAAIDKTLTGVDELHALAARVVYPNPAKAPAVQDRSHWTMTAPAETLIRELAWRNTGSAALLARRTPRFVTAASQGRGRSMKVSERFGNLLEVSRKIARAGGITFSALDEGDTILLRQRIPRDLSRQVRFTDLNGGLVDGKIGLVGPTVTAAIVAGQGEGADRQISEVVAETDLWQCRIETLVDRRDTSDGAVQDEAGIEAVTEGAATATASMDVVEIPGAVLGIDYQLGDTVTAQLADASVSAPVRAAEITWDGHGRTVALTLGDAPDERAPAWLRRVRDLTTRLNRQEAI